MTLTVSDTQTHRKTVLGWPLLGETQLLPVHTCTWTYTHTYTHCMSGTKRKQQLKPERQLGRGGHTSPLDHERLFICDDGLAPHRHVIM